MNDKPLPHHREIEQSLLAAVIIDAEYRGAILDQLEPEALYSTAHQLILRAARDLQDKGLGADLVLMGDRLRELGWAEKIGGGEALIRLVGVPMPGSLAAVQEGCAKVQAAHDLRRLLGVCNEITQNALSANGNAATVVNEALARFEKFSAQGGNVFKLVSAGEMKVSAPKWLVKPLFEAETLSVVFGDVYSGKSLFAIDMALCVATGADFHGMRTIKGPVVYIAGEGLSGITRRFKAWSIYRGIDYQDADLKVSQMPAAFCDPQNMATVSREIDRAAKQIGNPTLIVVDTLARNFGPGDENSTMDMGGPSSGPPMSLGRDTGPR